MKIRTVIGLTGATAASLVGMAGLAASPAGAAPAQQQDLPFTVPLFGPLSPAGMFPNVKVTGNCPTWLFSDPLGFEFTNGHAVVYRPDFSTPFAPFGGFNAEGTADLLDFNTGDTGFVGSAHVWAGQNGNANGQAYGGETVNFSGTATDGSGSTISIITNPGFNTSASGHQSGWGQENVSCNIVSPPG